jgi:hypothetical protein
MRRLDRKMPAHHFRNAAVPFGDVQPDAPAVLASTVAESMQQMSVKGIAGVLILGLGLCAVPALGGSHRGAHTSAKYTYSHPYSARCETCARDSSGHIRRSPAARREFRKAHPCPATGKTTGACPGYVIDHVQALKHGGADNPSNMQWQTQADAKAKDKWE